MAKLGKSSLKPRNLILAIRQDDNFVLVFKRRNKHFELFNGAFFEVGDGGPGRELAQLGLGGLIVQKQCKISRANGWRGRQNENACCRDCFFSEGWNGRRLVRKPPALQENIASREKLALSLAGQLFEAQQTTWIKRTIGIDIAGLNYDDSAAGFGANSLAERETRANSDYLVKSGSHEQ